MNIVAEITPTGTEIIAFVGVLFLILQGVVLWQKVFVRKPSIDKEFATKEELIAAKKAITEELQKADDRYTALHNMVQKSNSDILNTMRADKDYILNAGERRGKDLHERINMEADKTNEALAAMPGTIVKMLRDTKGLL